MGSLYSKICCFLHIQEVKMKDPSQNLFFHVGWQLFCGQRREISCRLLWSLVLQVAANCKLLAFAVCFIFSPLEGNPDSSYVVYHYC